MLYYYKKYYSYLETYYAEGEWLPNEEIFHRDDGVIAYKGYTFKSNSSSYKMSDPSPSEMRIWEMANSEYKYLWLNNWTLLQFLRIEGENAYFRVKEDPIAHTRYVRSSYITTAQAENGTYPENGRHTDGYWYVKSSEVNVKPNPVTITSPSGGEVITAPFPLTWTPATDDNAGDVISYYQIELTTNNGRNWELISNDIKGTNLLYDFVGKPDTSTAKIRVRAFDGELFSDWAESDVFTINYNYPPNPPYGLKPNTGDIVDIEKTIRFQWNHSDPNGSDPQSKFELAWRLVGKTTWNNISETTNRQYQDVPSFTFPLGTIEWRVKTYDQAGLVSEWSPLATFISGSKPSVGEWIYPTNGERITEPQPVFQWLSNAQTAYRVILYDENDFIVWDTGEIEGVTKAVTSGVTLEDGEIYAVSILVRNSEGFWSEENKISFTTSYSPPPKPVLNVYPNDATIIIEIDNPQSEGLQPETISNEVYKFINNEWIRIAKDIPVNGVFVDYSVRSNVTEQYKVKAVGDNEGIQYSDIKTSTATFAGVYIHDTADAELTVQRFKFDGGGRGSNWAKNYALMNFKGRKMPTVEFSENESRSVSVTLQLLNFDDLFALEELAKSYNTLCYRDGRGRLLFGFISSLAVSDEKFGNQAQFEFIGIDYQGSI